MRQFVFQLISSTRDHSRVLLACLFVFITVANAATSTLMMKSKYLGSSPVFVAGGSSGVGLELVKRLSAMATPVHVLVRRPEAMYELTQYPGVKAMLGNALNEADVQKCMEGCVAAVSTLGGKSASDKEVRVDYTGNSNVIEQAGILGVERIILVTSVGCGNTKGAVTPQVYRLFEETFTLKTKAERDLKLYTNLDWTIIRPGGLTSDPERGTAIFTEDVFASGVVTRADVARMIIEALGSEGKCTRRELTCIDPTFDPSYVDEPTEYKFSKFRL